MTYQKLKSAEDLQAAAMHEITLLSEWFIANKLSLSINTRNSSGDEIANVNFLYDDTVHTVKIQYRLLHKFRHRSFSATQVYQIQ